VSASKRKRGASVKRPKPSSKSARRGAKPARVAVRAAHTRRAPKPNLKSTVKPRKASRPQKPAAAAAARPAPAVKPTAKSASNPTVKQVAQVAPAAAHPTKKPTVIQPHQEAPKDTPAARPAAKAPAPKKPKPPAKTMQVPLPETAPLLTLSLPDVRRANSHKSRNAVSRGHLRPEPASKSKETDEEGGPVDASLIMSSLAVDAAPKIEDNYDYGVLDEFKASKFCPAPTRVVNTGCGGGEAAVYFAKLGFKVVGIDSDRLAVGLARERAWLASTDVDFMVGDLFETPNLLPAESFGLAIDRGAFYRLEDDRDRQRYLANIKRLLFQGGVLLLSAGFFPIDNNAGGKKAPPRGGTKLLLAREGGVVVNELRQAGFDLLHRILRKTGDSGDYGELLLYLKK
jgi:SAM-dependent methyltransferase